MLASAALACYEVDADFLNGRRDDGSYLFDRVTGITEGSAK